MSISKSAKRKSKASPICKANAPPPLANRRAGQQRIYTHTKSNLQRDFKEFRTKRHPGSRVSGEDCTPWQGEADARPAGQDLDESARSQRHLLFHQAIARSHIARLSGTLNGRQIT